MKTNPRPMTVLVEFIETAASAIGIHRSISVRRRPVSKLTAAPSWPRSRLARADSACQKAGRLQPAADFHQRVSRRSPLSTVIPPA